MSPGEDGHSLLTERSLWLAVAVLAAFLVFLVDYLTAAEISVFAFYLAPIALATWFVGAWAGVAVAIISLAARFVDLLISGSFSTLSVLYWNTAVEGAVFMSASWAVNRVRSGLVKQRALTRQLRAAYASLDRELAIIGDIQHSLLPASLPEIPGYRIVVHYATSARSGGDYYDFFPLPDGRIGILIADASGHGSPAAVVMAIVRVLMHTAPDALFPPDRVLAVVNERLARNVLPGQFVTACYAVLDPTTRLVDYSLAGHNLPLVARGGSGEVETFVNEAGPPLGIFEQAPFARHAVRLGAGDTLLLYTDGLTDILDSEHRIFGDERVRRIFAECHDAEPEAIRDRLLAELRAFLGSAPPADDVTLILLRAL